MNRNRKSSPPPFYWKIPVPEKDYMTENYRKMRSIAAEGQRKRSEPLKAHFVPGVTKNSKYAHVQSKVGAFLKGHGQPLQNNSSVEELANRRLQHSQRFSVRNNVQNQASQRRNENNLGHGRISKSSHDLRCLNSEVPPYKHVQVTREGSISASNVPRPAQQSMSQPEFPTVRILEPNPPDESIYKWKFSEDPPNIPTNNDGTQQSTKYPHQHCHRVEYLPCDGICADETVIDNNTNPDSARSNSSRTSRGCNTEETRIFNDTPENKPFRYRSLSLGGEDEVGNIKTTTTTTAGVPSSTQHQRMQTKKKSIYTISGSHNGTSNENNYIQKRNKSSQDFNIITGNDLETQMKSLGFRSSNSQINFVNKPRNGAGGGSKEGGNGDFPHNLGTVPKYLKQRQQEWRVEEAAKKEAEKNAHIPPGYMLMSEEERIESLQSFKKNYDMLIAELNRIPIRIDTMRVRDHKVQLEKQLTRLEEAMKSFSRPKVWVKTDD